ncbi:MAG: hypothetical protein H8E15_02280 [Planctomycetes bacterium]|nr:hypothetical protein [Planctomycetota bacterium]
MNLDRQLQRRKGAYVQAISDALSNLPEVDREAVLEDVEDHIDSALYDGSGLADMNQLDEILASLGPPEDYAADVSARMDMPVGPSTLCLMAPVGMVWSIAAIVIAVPAMFFIRVVEVDGEGNPLEVSKTVLEYFWQALAWTSLAGLIGGPTVSSMAISRIRAARGRLCGLYPAVIGAYLIPLAIADLALFGLSFQVLNKGLKLSDDLANMIAIVIFIGLIIGSVQVVRRAYHRLSLVPTYTESETELT